MKELGDLACLNGGFLWEKDLEFLEGMSLIVFESSSIRSKLLG